MNDHERGVEAVAAKLRSPSTFPGEMAVKVARELIDAYIEAGGFDSVHAEKRCEALEAPRKFNIGDRVSKTKGSSWNGRVVGFYSTTLTPCGYCVESDREPGSVQIYPEAALAKEGE